MRFVKELPNSTRASRSNYEEIKYELMSNPQQWGIIKVSKNANAAGAMAGTLRIHKLFIGEGFEFASRKVGGECRVYGRYVGKARTLKRRATDVEGPVTQLRSNSA